MAECGPSWRTLFSVAAAFMSDTIHSSASQHKQAAIRRILDARFSLSDMEESKNNDPGWWNSKRNDMGRGIYGEAMRELRRLEAVTGDELSAELAAIAGFVKTRAE